MRIKIKSRKQQSKNRMNGRRYWVAMGTLAAYAAVGSGKSAWAKRQNDSNNAANAGSEQDQARAMTVRRFDIPAGQLDTVIDAFQQATGLQVSIAEQGIRTLSSPGVSGLYTVDQALQYLLAGTGVTYRFTGTSAVSLELRGTKSIVDVEAQVSQVASARFPEPILNTPQSIDVVSKAVMHDQGTTTLRDALRNFAGISLAAGEGGSQGDNLTIRGFTARNDLFLDGMRDFGSYYRDPFNLEQVEVLQGPSSVSFGRGSTGGVVNQASKVPALDHFMSASLQLGTNNSQRLTVDYNDPFSLFGKNAAFRVNVMGTIGDVAERDVARNRRFGVAPSLAFGLGTPTRLTLSYFHQNADDTPDYGIPWLFNGPAPVNRNNYYGLETGNYLRTYDDIGTVKLDHDFNSAITVQNLFRYSNQVRNVLITEPSINSPSLATPLNQLTVTRRQLGAYSTETSLDEQLNLTARVKTGFISHTVVIGAEGIRETSDPTRPTWPAAFVPTTSLLNPNPAQVFTGTAPITSNVHASAVTGGVYINDAMRFGRKWELTGGFRFDHMDSDYKQLIAPTSAFTRTDKMPSWRAALSYSPVPYGNVYFSAGTSFNPSAESLSLTAGTANAPPEKNTSYEAGTKWELAAGKLSMRAAVFRTDKTNARETDPTNPLNVVLAGSQRVDGIEGNITGRINRHWTVLAGYALLASKVVSSRYFPAAVGFPLANVPRNTANLWTTYELPWHHISVGGGTNFVDSRTASSTAPLDPITLQIKQVPSYWTFSAMTRFPLSEHVDAQINAYNLTNRYYYDQLHPGHIVLGEGRTVLIGFNFKF